MKKLIIFLACLLSSSAFAAPYEYEVTVESWEFYLRAGVDNNFEVRFSAAVPSTYAIAPAAATPASPDPMTACGGLKVFTRMNSNNGEMVMWQSWQSALQYAAATNTSAGAGKVKVLIRADLAVCDATRGANLLGVRNMPLP